MMKIILARHGETEFNVSGQIQGQYDSKLTENGKLQAKALAEALKKEKIDKIYTSKLSRAIETADAINKFHDLKIKKEKDLNERSWGVFEKKHGKDVDKKEPGALKDPSFKAKKGENFEDVIKRVEPFLKKLIKENQKKKILIVAHKMVLLAILKILLNISIRQSYKLKQDSTCIDRITILKKVNRLDSFNDTDHLKKRGLKKVAEAKGIC